VRPSAHAVSIAQHRVLEKQFIRDAGIPVAPFVVVNVASDLPADGADIYPAILKVARFGYDGKGQSRVANQSQALAAFETFKGEQCVLEKMLSLDYEVSIVLAREEGGSVAVYPTAENSHLNGILDVSIVPARAPQSIQKQARELAIKIAEKLEYIGVMAVEFFVSEGQLLANEMAPRPHNSGHYTIDACVTNQFEQQLRALTGLPLGDARLHSQAVMVNILGDVWNFASNGSFSEPDWAKVFANPELKLHLYGKHEPRLGRKMGHFTVIGAEQETVIVGAVKARAELGIG
jgi:5-(carboxyamino)imidazole ribonucleotide synthase